MDVIKSFIRDLAKANVRTRREKERVVMTDALIRWNPRSLGEHALSTPKDPECGVILPYVELEIFEIKPTLIFMVPENPFRGLSSENQYSHIKTFLEIINIVKYGKIS